jgi:hypothetical protein
MVVSPTLMMPSAVNAIAKAGVLSGGSEKLR